MIDYLKDHLKQKDTQLGGTRAVQKVVDVPEKEPEMEEMSEKPGKPSGDQSRNLALL